MGGLGGPMVGGGGTKTLIFEPTGEGDATIQFALANVWIDAFDPEDSLNGEILEIKSVDIEIR